MRVRVRYFAAVREALGSEGEELDVPVGSSVEDLQILLETRHPALAGHRRGLRFALDLRFASAEARLREGSEVAFIPPVSGG